MQKSLSTWSLLEQLASIRIRMILLSVMFCAFQLFAAPSQADLIPVRNGQPFGTLLNPVLDPDFDANAPAPPVVTDTDNPIVAVYDSKANVTWMSDEHLFQEQYNANLYFLSTLVGRKVANPDGTRHTVTANDFWYAASINRQLASMSGVIAWIDSLNDVHYLGAKNWTLPRLADAQSLWNQLTAMYPANASSGGAPCSFLKTIGFSGCGYYDDDVGPFTYIVPTSWTVDKVGKGEACYYNVAFSTPGGDLFNCHNSDQGLESTAIVPGYTGANQESGPGTNIEFFSSPLAVVRCNVFEVQVPGEPARFGHCK